MEQILKSRQNKIIEAPNIINLKTENQIKVDSDRKAKYTERSDNVNTKGNEQDQNKFKLPTPVPRKLIRNEILTNPENKRNEA